MYLHQNLEKKVYSMNYSAQYSVILITEFQMLLFSALFNSAILK